ncbi:hypothetical protein [Mycobacterium sp. 852002-40037_SCH5390672]|nr:hypothetical protein [Mycobacterium sp. 852002-40037_SCH5390672]
MRIPFNDLREDPDAVRATGLIRNLLDDEIPFEAALRRREQ